MRGFFDCYIIIKIGTKIFNFQSKVGKYNVEKTNFGSI
jgi:hypothetical protein